MKRTKPRLSGESIDNGSINYTTCQYNLKILKQNELEFGVGGGRQVAGNRDRKMSAIANG